MLTAVLIFCMTAEITAYFDWVDLAVLGLTLTPLAGRILLLLTELLGGNFGAALTNVDFLIRAALTADLAGLFWACNSDICTLSLC